MESSEVKLARIEERLKAQWRFTEECFRNYDEKLDDFIATQKASNKLYWQAVKEVQDIKSRAKGAWWIILQMGSLTTVVAGLVSWVVANWKGH